MKVLVYEYRWCDDPTQTKFQASNGARFGEKFLNFGDRISIEVCSGVQCGGSMRDGEWKNCADRLQGRKKCESCRAREGQFVFTSFDGFNTDNLTAEDLDKIGGSHLVYLALFDRELVKVGVCKKERKILRQVEQGSHATLFIADTDNGILARQLETTMRDAGIADKIQAGKKKDSLVPELSREDCENILQEKFKQYIPALEGFPQLQKFVLETPEFCMWEDLYHLQTVEERSKPFHNVKLEEGEWISGTIVARKGPFVVIETPEELVSILTKDLCGREIEFDLKSPGLGLTQAVQNSLF